MSTVLPNGSLSVAAEGVINRWFIQSIPEAAGAAELLRITVCAADHRDFPAALHSPLPCSILSAMSPISPDEREAAERRVEEIKIEIRANFDGDGPTEERIKRWRAPLTESLELQPKLDADE